MQDTAQILHSRQMAVGCNLCKLHDDAYLAAAGIRRSKPCRNLGKLWREFGTREFGRAEVLRLYLGKSWGGDRDNHRTYRNQSVAPKRRSADI